MVIYEHYNVFKDYDPNRSFPISNWKETNKPFGGLWGSRVGASRNWKKYIDWSEKHYLSINKVEGFVPPELKKFHFKLKENAKVLMVTSHADFLKLPTSVDEETGREYVDYLKIRESGVDAVELCSLGEEFEEYYDEETIDQFDDEFCQYWSCDSIVVINKDAYEILDEAS